MGNPNRNVHVVPNGDDWSVKRPNAQRPSRVFPTQSDAIGYGRDLAKKDQSELLIHNQNGVIRDKRSYGNDPCPPRDKR